MDADHIIAMLKKSRDEGKFDLSTLSEAEKDHRVTQFSTIVNAIARRLRFFTPEQQEELAQIVESMTDALKRDIREKARRQSNEQT